MSKTFTATVLSAVPSALGGTASPGLPRLDGLTVSVTGLPGGVTVQARSSATYDNTRDFLCSSYTASTATAVWQVKHYVQALLRLAWDSEGPIPPYTLGSEGWSEWHAIAFVASTTDSVAANLVATPSATSGTAQVAYSDDTYALDSSGTTCAGAGTIQKVTSTVVNARLVRARAIITRLTPGLEYEVTLRVATRPRAGGPWTPLEERTILFTAEASTEFTYYVDLVATPGNEVTISGCSAALYAPESTYDDCYTLAYNGAQGSAYDTAYATGYAAGLACAANPAGTEPTPTAYSPGPEKTCEDGTTDGEIDGAAYGEWQGLQFGWEDGTEDASCT